MELDIAARLAHQSNIRTISRGTAAVNGRGVTHETAGIARRRGLDASAHVARQLSHSDVRSASLVLTATRAQRATVISLFPRATQYAFTLKEFARLVNDNSSSRTVQIDTDCTASLRTAAARARARRGPARPIDADHDDVVDPFNQSSAVYEQSAREIFAASASVVQALLRL